MKKTMLSLFLALALVLSACGQTATTEKPATDAVTEAATTTEAASDATEATEAAATTYPVTITDGLGNEITLDKEPEKIVSMAPNVTEILFALGLGDKVVAVSEFSDYPAEASEIETIGGAMGYDLERIAELAPDVIVTNGMVEGIDKAGAPVAGYYPQTMEEVMKQIEQIGELTNTSAKAKEITDDMRARIEKVKKSVQGLDAPTVFYEVWGDPLMVAGKGSFINEMITLSGGIDVAGDAEPYSNYSVEQLVEKNPSLYIINDGDPNLTAQTIAERPGYADLDAVKNDRVLAVDADLISRPGPRIVEGLEAVADFIHPDRAK